MMDNIIDVLAENLEYIDKEYKKILGYCQLDKLQRAIDVYRTLMEWIENTIKVSSEMDKKAYLDKLEFINSDQRIKRLKGEQVEIDDLLKIMDNDIKLGGWTEISQKSGISCYYKQSGDSGMHTIRMEGIIESPVFDVCSVIMEVGLYTTWIPKLKEASTLGTDNRFRKLIYARVGCPFPVADRDICLYGYGVDMLEDSGQVLVVARTVREGDLSGVDWTLPKEVPNVVRADTRISGFIIKPLDENRTHVKVVALSDPIMSYIPYWLLNFVTNQFCHYLFVMLRKQSKSVKASKSYQEIINSSPIYKDLKEMSNSYFKLNHNNTI